MREVRIFCPAVSAAKDVTKKPHPSLMERAVTGIQKFKGHRLLLGGEPRRAAISEGALVALTLELMRAVIGAVQPNADRRRLSEHEHEDLVSEAARTEREPSRRDTALRPPCDPRAVKTARHTFREQRSERGVGVRLGHPRLRRFGER